MTVFMRNTDQKLHSTQVREEDVMRSRILLQMIMVAGVGIMLLGLPAATKESWIETVPVDKSKAIWPRFRTSQEIASSPFGTHTTVLSEGVGSPAELIRDISRAGFKWVKDYIAAGNLPEGQNPRTYYRWAEPSAARIEYLRMAREAGLNILLRLSDFRFNGELPVTPEARQAFAEFCRLQVHHYKAWVKDWEIWNEPNIGNEKPELQPADYALLANEAYRAIKEEDPEARIYVGATAMLQCLADHPYPWIKKAIDAGLKGDVFSFHPYCQPYVGLNMPEHGSQFHPWRTWGSYEEQIVDLRGKLSRSLLTKNVAGEVRIANTEAGWPTNVSQDTWKQEISYLTQAKYEQRAMLLDFWLGVSPRINFIFTRPFADLYHIEAQFQLVDPVARFVAGEGQRYRPVYFAAAAVCSVFDDGLQRMPLDTQLESAQGMNPRILSFKRIQPESGLSEVVIVIWAGVPARDDFEAGQVNLHIKTEAEKVVSIPVGFFPITCRGDI